MSSWAGIESTPPEPAGSAPVVAGSASAGLGPAGGRGAGQPVAVRRLRRQQRPVIGSLDAAGAMTQRHAREVLLGAALIILPGVVVNLGAATLAFDRYEAFSDSVVSVPELLGGADAATGIEEVLWFVGLLVNSLAACLVGGYAASLVVRRQTGSPVTIGSGYRGLWRRLPALVVAWLIGHSWILIGAWLLRNVDGGGLAPVFILGSPLVIVMITMTALVAPAIVVERLGAMAGLRRAWRLARTSFGTLFGFTIGSIVIGAVVQYGIAYLPRLLQSAGLVTFGRFGWLIEGVAGQLGRLVSMPIVAIATALVYLELRMHLEGMDLTLDADRAFGTRR